MLYRHQKYSASTKNMLNQLIPNLDEYMSDSGVKAEIASIQDS